MRRYQCYYRQETLEPDEFGSFYLVEEVDAEIARLRKALVKAAFCCMHVGNDYVTWVEGLEARVVDFDGTDDSLIETLCRLAEGE